MRRSSTGSAGMRQSISIAELDNMSPAARVEKMNALMRSTDRQPNGEIEELNETIRIYEEAHRMTSEVLLESLNNGQQAETAEVCGWLMAINLRNRLAKLKARAD